MKMQKLTHPPAHWCDLDAVSVLAASLVLFVRFLVGGGRKKLTTDWANITNGDWESLFFEQFFIFPCAIRHCLPARFVTSALTTVVRGSIVDYRKGSCRSDFGLLIPHPSIPPL